MPRSAEGFCTIDAALDELRAGRMIVLVDDEHRENEGDLVVAAEKASPETINFMLTHGRGILCLAMSTEMCDRLHLDPQTSVNMYNRHPLYNRHAATHDHNTTAP